MLVRFMLLLLAIASSSAVATAGRPRDLAAQAAENQARVLESKAKRCDDPCMPGCDGHEKCTHEQKIAAIKSLAADDFKAEL